MHVTASSSPLYPHPCVHREFRIGQLSGYRFALFVAVFALPRCSWCFSALQSHVCHAMQVSDCNLRVDLYAAGGWAGLSNTDREAVMDYGSAFEKQLRPIMESEVNHGGFVMPCLVHCVSGYAFCGRGLVGGISPSAAFLMWYGCMLSLRFCASQSHGYSAASSRNRQVLWQQQRLDSGFLCRTVLQPDLRLFALVTTTTNSRTPE